MLLIVTVNGTYVKSAFSPSMHEFQIKLAKICKDNVSLDIPHKYYNESCNSKAIISDFLQNQISHWNDSSHVDLCTNTVLLRDWSIKSRDIQAQWKSCTSVFVKSH